MEGGGKEGEVREGEEGEKQKMTLRISERISGCQNWGKGDEFQTCRQGPLEKYDSWVHFELFAFKTLIEIVDRASSASAGD